MKHGWPDHKSAPSLFSTYLAWATLVDLGEYPATTTPEPGSKTKPLSTFQKFRDVDCLHIDDGDDDELVDDVDPTQEAAEPEPASK